MESRRAHFGCSLPVRDGHLQASPTSPAHFKRTQERPSVKKLLAYEKEVNEGFAKTA